MYCGIYLCLGYPTLPKSLECLQILQQQPCVDFIELGLPFSDPVADGPVISAAAQVAMAATAEYTPQELLRQACDHRSNSSKDFYLMTYGNIVYHLLKSGELNIFGPFHGIIIPDVPRCEQPFFRQHGLNRPFVPFITPESTAADLKELNSAPFIYFVTVRGITGGQTDFASPELRRQYAAVSGKQCPVVLGFGIQGKKQIAQLAEFATGFVVGTAAVRLQGQTAAYRSFLNELFCDLY